MPADTVEGFYVPAGDGEPYPFGGGGVATFKVRGEDTGGHFEITENTIPPGHRGTPPHIHNSLDHAWYVLDGVVDFQVGDRVVHARRGACVFAPKGMAHRFSNPGTEPGKWLQIDSVGGREAMFKEMADRLPDDAPPDPAVLLEIFSKYDTRPARLRIRGGNSMPERFAVAVIGAGQAGLVTSHHLPTQRIEHVVFEHGRMGGTWHSSRWDFFTLITPKLEGATAGASLLRARPRWLHATYGDRRLLRTLRSSCLGTSAGRHPVPEGGADG